MLGTVGFFCFPLLVQADGFTYTNHESRYSFVLPEGWREIPRETIAQSIQAVADQAGIQKPEYQAGFQLSDRADFEYPYILLQYHDVKTPSYEEVMREFSPESVIFEEVKRDLSGVMSDLNVSKTSLDKERNIVFIPLQFQIDQIGEVRGLTALMLGKSGITQLNFYNTAEQYANSVPVFEAILNSFHYDAGYEYNPSAAWWNDYAYLFDGVGQSALIGAAIGIFIGLVWSLVQRLLPKKK